MTTPPSNLRMVTVPAIVGKQEEEAIAALYNVGLRSTTMHRSEANQPDRVVMLSVPMPGQSVRYDSTVQLVVNMRPAGSATPRTTMGGSVALKNYAGMDVQTAVADIAALGLRASVKYTASGTQQFGKVVQTVPPGGSQVSAGTTITVYVAK